MEMAIFYDNEKAGPFMRGYISVKALPKKICVKMISITMRAKELGQDHPRKIIHYLKVRLALTLVSLFYYFRLLYNGFGVNAIWTVLTVVVMFKFSIGARSGKGLNRMLATSVTATLGIGTHKAAILSGTTMEPILLAFFVFILDLFPPEMKTRHDSGLIVFDLTFCMVFASGYQENQAITIACQRASTIILSSFTAILVCIFICPVWSGEQLQDLIAPNMDKLGFGDKYFGLSNDARSKEDGRSFESCRTLLTSKDKEEMLVNLVRWGPCHGQFWFHYPWKHHLKIGTLIHHCAYKIEVLNSYLHSYTRIMTRPSTSPGIYLANAEAASKELKLLLESGWWEGADLLDIILATTVVLLLIDIAECQLKISEAVNELAFLAHFKCAETGALRSIERRHMTHQGSIQLLSDHEDETLQPLLDEDMTHRMITIEGQQQSSSKNENASRPAGENG
ncbi:hypothetical protein ACJRO7_003526 [Eucalyptus globulus]|uniref:Uncharacterized protein n=1 Tax=Eucalyptus globulus TaxID=34317 RepID=A0ABD3IUC4_EUCGL